MTMDHAIVAVSLLTFAKDWKFTHVTSSPKFPQSNGLAEKAVQIVKNILRKSFESSDDLNMALLVYRSTPMENGLSPAEMLMGRKIQSNLPIVQNRGGNEFVVAWRENKRF